MRAIVQLFPRKPMFIVLFIILRLDSFSGCGMFISHQEAKTHSKPFYRRRHCCWYLEKLFAYKNIHQLWKYSQFTPQCYEDLSRFQFSMIYRFLRPVISLESNCRGWLVVYLCAYDSLSQFSVPFLLFLLAFSIQEKIDNQEISESSSYLNYQIRQSFLTPTINF